MTRISRTFQTRLPGSKLAIPTTEQPWRGLRKGLQGYLAVTLEGFCFCSSWLIITAAWTFSVMQQLMNYRGYSACFPVCPPTQILHWVNPNPTVICTYSNSTFLCPIVINWFLLIDLAKLFFFLINYFMAALDLRCCTWAFSSCGEWGLLFIAMRGFLIAVASLVAEHGL